jgi:CrcB protein
MLLSSILSIGSGAVLGALLRWWLGGMLNPIFPSIPLGTLAANLMGGFLMGIFMAVTKNYPFLPEALRLAITTGFLGGLTTFSTFSAETVTLLSHQEYLMTAIIMIGHVAGSILATIFGIYTVRLLTS